MLINAIDAEESRIAVVEDGVLQELHVEIANREAYLGNIYKGRVVNIEPSIGAAFVNFGGSSNGFLHVSDVLPAYGDNEYSLQDIIEGRARVSGEDGPDAVRSVLKDGDGDEDGEGEDVDFDHDEDDDHDDHDEDDGASDDDREDHGDDDRDDRDDRGERAAADDEASEGAAEEVAATGDEAPAAAEDDGREDGPREEEAAEPIAKKTRSRSRSATKKPRTRRRAPKASDDEDGASSKEGDRGESDAPEGEGPRDSGSDADPDPTFLMAPGKQAARAPSKDSKARVESVGKRGRGRKAPRRSNPRERMPRVPIDQLLKKGQEVVVQVTKEGIGAKGPTLTTYVSLPGRCLVLMPSLPKCGVSRKIESDKERRRLKKIVRALDETGTGGLGFIVRTAGVDKTRDELERDRDYLKKIWELVAQRLQATRAPAVLYKESDLVMKAMRDLFSPDIEDVVVDSKDVFLRIKDFTEKLMPRMAERVKRHESTTPIFHAFGIEGDLQGLYVPRVELPSGISIVIDQTEALVAIDVNSGKFKPGTNLEETAYKTNMEAISEITRQLRLRDMGGVIIIDFIDMTTEKHKRAVERKLVDCMKGDKARIKIGRISPFGMMELTRQRVGPGLKRTVFNTCGHCDGAGMTRTAQSKALSVLRDVRAILHLKGFSVLQVFVAPAVNDFLVNFKRRTILDLEEDVGKSVIIRGEHSYPVDVVHYRFLTADGQEAKVVIPAGLGVHK